MSVRGSRPPHSNHATSSAEAPSAPRVLDTWSLSASEAHDVWRDIIDGTYVFERGVEDRNPHRVRAKVWLLDDLLFSDLEAEANTVSRTPELIRKTPSELIKLNIYHHGHMDVFDGEAGARLGPDMINFMDHDRPSTQVSSQHRQTSIFLPYHLVGYDPSRHAPTFGIGRDTAGGRMIEAGVNSVFSALPTLEKDEAPAVLEGLSGLIKGVLSGRLNNAESDEFRQARMHAIRQLVDDRLGDPELGSDLILAKFGVSRTTLYRTFEEHGGVQRYVMKRRLHRAFRILAEGARKRGIVQDLADKVGFSSVHHFSRAFREEFGEAPSDVVGRWVASEPLQPSEKSIGTISQKEMEQAIEQLRWSYKRFSRTA